MTPRQNEPLLELLLRQVDHGYQAAAKRKTTRSSAHRLGLRVTLVIVLLLVGLLLAIAFRHTSEKEPGTKRTKQALIEEISQRRESISNLEDRASRLKRQTESERDKERSTARDADRAGDEVENTEAATGTGEVRGPGLVVTVGDGPTHNDPNTGEETSESQAAKVIDRDLHELVNALWQAGAEAIAIDGHRLTGVSAIRAAGAAILVDFRPVTNPYEIAAVGDPRSLRADFEASDVAARFRGYPDRYGMQFEISGEARLELPAVAVPPAEHAQPGTP